ncbi:MAG: hypothetical protein HY722_12935, partial [Planctomycetes bacterium]|nr:hypothetical protein [Planctomycetota bacterium]
MAVVPERFSEAMEPLLSLRREGGFEVEVLRPGGRGAEGLAAAVRAADPRYVLLVGDHEEVPACVDEWEATDNVYGDLDGDGLPEAAVGRLPADTPEELSRMVGRIVAAEREARPGEWQNDLAFLAGQGGFGPVLDRMLEQVYREVIVHHVPAAYDVDMSYANPVSPYCFPPPGFSGAALERANRGSLIYTYLGHGHEEGFDTVEWRGRSYPILSTEDASAMDSAHPPVMVVIACLTGRFDGVEGIGEVLMRRPRGPLAFLGASRVSQPYSNAVLGLELVRAALDPEVHTVGEMA